MRLSITSGRHTAEVQIDGVDAETTVRALLAALGYAPPQSVWVEGREVPADHLARDALHDGASIDMDGRPPTAPDPTIEFHAVSGIAAGRVWRLASGRYQIGDTAAAHLSWPGAPDATITVEAEGRVAADGVALEPGANLRLGDSWFQIRDAAPPPSSDDGLVTFNRPPRHLRNVAPTPLPAPTRAVVLGTPRRLSVIALILPALFGIAMAVFFHRVMFLAFALMGPLMMVGNTIDDRRRRRRQQQTNDDEFGAALADLRRSIEAEARRARDRQIDAHPTPAALLSAVDRGAPQLWERRPAHPDFMTVAAGTGSMEWRPILEHTPTDPEVLELAQQRLASVPIDLDLTSGRVVGVSGSRDRAAEVAVAWLCQVAVQHGPADVRIAILTDEPARWDWAKWLPHVQASDGEVLLLASHPQEMSTILGFLRTRPASGSPPLTVLISDQTAVDPDLRNLHREVLGGAGMPVAGIVIRDRHTDLPGLCSTVLALSEDPATMSEPGTGRVIDGVVPWTMAPDAARHLARRLARFQDPEAATVTGALPDLVPLLQILDLDEDPAQAIARRWTDADAAGHLSAAVGAVPGGLLTVDLVTDGPHGLVAGTTGSGKSELLRSLVAGLAASYGPDLLTFVLIDYKGGSAFDSCSRLPHVVGLVTDLDEHLGARALTCLEAELRFREERLRSVGAADIKEYLEARHPEPLPRLVLIVDEFAAMAAELPDFMNSLVGIAQRGRSLGVHMILATQRPSGVVKDSIRANTNLRISLRVQSPADSKDVLADAAAAHIPRSRPGRGFLRLGPGELVAFQSAIATLPHDGSGRMPLSVQPFAFGMRVPEPPRPRATTGPTDLDIVVDGARRAFEAANMAAPRRPWPDPLPGDVRLSTLEVEGGGAAIAMALADEPHRQRRRAFAWTGHNLLLLGMHGRGTTDGLRALAVGAARHHPDDLQVYAIDHTHAGLAGIAPLPHVGAVIDGSDRERQQRMLRMLRGEIEHRKAGRGNPPTILLLLDGLAGFKATFDEMTDLEYREMLTRIITDGPGVRVYTAVTADQARTVPGAMSGLFRERLAFQLADRMDYGTLGISTRDLPDLPVGRAIDVVSGLHLQIGLVSDEEIATLAASAPAPTLPPPPVEVLPETVKLADVVDRGSRTGGWRLPIGIADHDLQVASLTFRDGDHALISGPARSGKSTALATVAAAIRHIDPGTTVIAVCPRRSPLVDLPELDHVMTTTADLGRVLAETGEAPTVMVIDDADEVEDPGGAVEQLIASRRADLHVIAAARPDALRGAFRHWTKALKASRRGLVLCPIDPGDAEPLGARLPRGGPGPMPPGRGYLVDGGTIELVQTAIP